MFRTIALLIPAAFTLLAAPLTSLAQSVDQVYLSKGAPSRGRIPESGINREQVTLEASSGAKQFEVNEIVRITFADEPAELNNARTAVIQKNYNHAAQELRKLDPQKIERTVIKQEIEYLRALAQARLAMTEGGDKNAAITAMLNFVKSAPQSFHFYDAAETLGDLSMSLGKFADAAKYYTPIASAKWPDYQLKANSAIGRALVGEKQYDQALTKFETVIKSDATGAEAARQKLLATTGKAVCLAETGKAEEGVALMQEIIKNNDPQDAPLFARTYNALGRCYLKLNKPKDALLAFLHVEILFAGEADAHAEALYHLSKLWGDINKSDRAVTARTTLRERYAGSIWATLE
jgi:tetratricopeptide (TPR) repeat protein